MGSIHWLLIATVLGSSPNTIDKFDTQAACVKVMGDMMVRSVVEGKKLLERDFERSLKEYVPQRERYHPELSPDYKCMPVEGN